MLILAVLFFIGLVYYFFVFKTSSIESSVVTSQKVSESGGNNAEQAVLVYIKLSDNEFGSEEERDGLFELEDRLEQRIIENDAGELDGNEFGEGYCILYMYGPNADNLKKSIFQILKEAELPTGSYLIKRYGMPGAREKRIDF